MSDQNEEIIIPVVSSSQLTVLRGLGAERLYEGFG